MIREQIEAAIAHMSREDALTFLEHLHNEIAGMIAERTKRGELSERTLAKLNGPLL